MSNQDLSTIQMIIDNQSLRRSGQKNYALECMKWDLKELNHYHFKRPTPEILMLRDRIEKLKTEIDQIDFAEMQFYKSIEQMIKPFIKEPIEKQLTMQNHFDLEQMMRLKEEEIN